DLDLLIHRYFERTLSPDEAAGFWQRLKTDPAAADRFVELAELESGLVESLKADEEMPSGVYKVIHGTRRRARPLPPVRDRAVWPYWVAAGLFIAALSILLRSERTPDPTVAVRERDRAEVPAPKSAPPPPAVRGDLEARRTRQQEVLRELERKEEELAVARRKAETEKQEPAQRDLEKSLAELAARRREEAATLARVEEDLAKPEPTRVSDPAPAPGAVLEAVEGEVAWVGVPAAAPKAGQPVPESAGLSTVGARSRLVVKLPDDTRLELKSDGRLEDFHATGDLKRLNLTKGTLLASVAKQTGARSLVVVTPHAEITVLGTRFLVQVGSDETRLDVEEGKVRNRRLSDKRTVEVAAGHTLSTGKTGALTPKPLPLVRSFQDGVLPTPDYAGTQDTSIGSASMVPAGSQDLLRVYREAGREVQNTALLRWDISSIPPRSRVVSAELTFWVTGVQAGGAGARAFEMRRAWDEADATWKLARPGSPWQVAGARGDGDAASRAIAQITPSAPGWFTVPLNDAGVALVQQWVNAPASNFGIGVTKDPPNAWDLASREWATKDHRPKLTVSYIPPAK
ncbi:MAG: FecR domain-containing protein, partial [Planctomycetaceae bacterium]|nr:FecR domain-containing protein [Planctomycetaceae bacterium]